MRHSDRGAGGAEVALLGPLELRFGAAVVIGLPPKERALVGLLALREGRPVPLHEIADCLWAGDPPATARKGMQVLAYRLRRRIEDAAGEGTGVALATLGEAYRLEVSPGGVDAHRFERLVEEGRRDLATGDAASALARCNEALDLWRGEPLVDLGDSDVGVAERTRLVELRRAAEDEQREARLALGEHVALVGELESALADDRLRERRWRHLMLALYRSGRQADALRAYQRVRSILVDELGIEPGPDLRRLEAAIIAHDPALDLAPPVPQTAARGPAPELGHPWIDRHRRHTLIGRRPELERLRERWRDVRTASAGTGPAPQGAVVLITGEAGVGKSRLVAELAAEVDAGDVVVAIACRRGAGVGPVRDALDQLPAASRGRPARAEDDRWPDLLQALTELPDGTGALLVVDDLHEADASLLERLRAGLDRIVDRPVLLVVTSRSSERTDPARADLLADLHRLPSTSLIGLAGMGTDDAVDLLGQVIDRDVSDDSRLALAALAADAAGRPLYLVDLARHAVARGAIDDTGRWRGDVGVSALGIPPPLRSYVDGRLARLDEDTARLVAAAAVVGPSVDRETVAAAAGIDPASALDHLDALVDAGFLAEAVAERDRYEFTVPLERKVLLARLSAARRASIEARLGPAVAPAAPLDRAAEERLRGGDLTGAWQLFGEAAEAARTEDDIRALATAAVGASKVLVNLGVRHPPVIDLLSEAHAVLAPDDPLRDEVRAALVRELLWAGRWHEAADLAGSGGEGDQGDQGDQDTRGDDPAG